MSDSSQSIPESEASWIADLDHLTKELNISYKVVYSPCEPGSLYQWRAELRVLKYKSVGFGHHRQMAKEAAVKNIFPWLRLSNAAEIERMRRMSLLGTIRAERGRKNELVALRALQDSSLARPSWFKSVRHAEPEEDERGIDLVIETHDVGKLYLQVKSSQVFACHFSEKRRPSLIGVIVVSHNDDPRELNQRAMDELEGLYQRVLAKRNGSSG